MGRKWTDAPRRTRPFPRREEPPHPARQAARGLRGRRRRHPRARRLPRGVSPRAAWERAGRADPERSTRSSADSRLLKRHFFAGAAQGELDRQGRLVVPARLIEHAGLGARGHRHRRPRPPRDLGSQRPGDRSSTRSKGERKMLPSVLPTETDHVPVLADEVVAALAPRPGETDRRRHVRRRRPRVAAREAAAGRREADRDRPRPDRRAVLRAVPPRDRRQGAPAARRVLGRPRSSSPATACAPTSSCSTSASRRCSSTAPSAASRTRSTRRSTCAWTRAAEYSARELVNEAAERDLADIFRRYGEERYARPIARAIVRQRAEQPVRAHGRARRDDQGGDPRAGPVR